MEFSDSLDGHVAHLALAAKLNTRCTFRLKCRGSALADDATLPLRHRRHHIRNQPACRRRHVKLQIERDERPAPLLRPCNESGEVDDAAGEAVGGG
jgi:hypothetical protein